MLTRPATHSLELRLKVNYNCHKTVTTTIPYIPKVDLLPITTRKQKSMGRKEKQRPGNSGTHICSICITTFLSLQTTCRVLYSSISSFTLSLLKHTLWRQDLCLTAANYMHPKAGITSSSVLNKHAKQISKTAIQRKH